MSLLQISGIFLSLIKSGRTKRSCLHSALYLLYVSSYKYVIIAPLNDASPQRTTKSFLIGTIY